MFRNASTFSSFSVDDVAAARRFYGDTLGLDVDESPMGMLEIKLGDGHHVTAYSKPNHQPATYTVLNFIAPDIEKAVDDLAAAGVTMERYDMPGLKTDQRGIARDQYGPPMAWFKDPAGNILAVMGQP